MISEKKNIKKTTKKKNRFASIIFRFKKNKLALFGLIIFALMVFMAIFADFIVDYETEAIKTKHAKQIQSSKQGTLFWNR